MMRQVMIEHFSQREKRLSAALASGAFDEHDFHSASP